MKVKFTIFIFGFLVTTHPSSGQDLGRSTEKDTVPHEKFYVAVSYGASFSVGDFADTDINNAKAGLADNGRKLDVIGGFALSKKWILAAKFRYQTFETELDDALNQFNAENSPAVFSGTSGDWETFQFLIGVGREIKIAKNFKLYPLAGIGPMWVTNPGVTIVSSDPTSNQNFTRSSETELGFGGEIGLTFRKDIGRHFALMPNFTYGGGLVNYSNIETTRNNTSLEQDYEARIQSITIGLVLAYRFY